MIDENNEPIYSNLNLKEGYIWDYFGKCEAEYPVCEQKYLPEEWAQGRRGYDSESSCNYTTQQNSSYLIGCGQMMCYFCDNNNPYLPPSECTASGGYLEISERDARCSTGQYCSGANCGGASDPAPENDWQFFCSMDVGQSGGGSYTWDGSKWNLDSNNDCSTRCSCCINNEPPSYPGYEVGSSATVGCRCINGC
jgi:hypothetical protein